MAERVVIVGGGLAGLAAAVGLAPRGFDVTIIEARNRLGGRASSFADPASGQLLDNCQHVSMGCCTNFSHFCKTVGISHLLEPQPYLYFMTPDRRVSRFGADPLPAPFHLARSFVMAHFLSLADKLRIARGLVAMQSAEVEADLPFSSWLRAHGQSSRTIERFWSVVLTSALNETPERVGCRYARKVFVDAFLRHRDGFTVELPKVPLGRLYGQELLSWLETHGVQIQLNQGARILQSQQGRVVGVELRQGDVVSADWFILAVPFGRVPELLPADLPECEPIRCNAGALAASPITSVHLWYDRPVLTLPHVVLVGCIGQWVFNRGQGAAGEHYVQVVVSAARQFRGMNQAAISVGIAEELNRLMPQASTARLLRSRVVTEQAATFSAVPGVDKWRPAQTTDVSNLFLAGDWTATGWPATMEGAVRSGYLAAQAILRKKGIGDTLLEKDL